MATRTSLTVKQERFVGYVLEHGNATKAAEQAGYSKKTAYAMGAENLWKPQIAAEIEHGRSRQQKRAEKKQDNVCDAMRVLAYTDRTEMLDDVGNIKPLSEWPQDLRDCVESIEIVKRNAFAGDGQTDIIWKVKFVPKLGATIEVGRLEGQYPKEPATVVQPVVYTWIQPKQIES